MHGATPATGGRTNNGQLLPFVETFCRQQMCCSLHGKACKLAAVYCRYLTDLLMGGAAAQVRQHGPDAIIETSTGLAVQTGRICVQSVLRII